MSKSNHEQVILKEVILGIRNVISDRYQYDSIKNHFTLSPNINATLIDQIRAYLLAYVYPDTLKRSELDKAFQRLDNYTKEPKKLLNILMDSTRLIFTHGIYLPKILQTGLKALGTYSAATKFEDRLAAIAIEKQIAPPYDVDKTKALIKAIPKQEVEHFIDACKLLLETLYDRKLMKNLLEILSYLIQKMKSKQELYSKDEIRGLEIGRDLLITGDSIFKQLNQADQRSLIELIISIEKKALEQIHNN